jgi:uncharacterized protein (TIRG00374 family)
LRTWAGRLAGAAIAASLLFLIVKIARPATVWHLLRTTDGRMLIIAITLSAGFLAMRGLRLMLLLEPGQIRMFRATLVAAAAQAAALFAPLRTGELAFPWLLDRTTGHGFASGVGTLLAARTLDVATLGIWAGAAVLAVRGLTEPLALVVSLLLVTPPLLLPATMAVADRAAVRLLATRGLRGRRWARRIRRVRQELTALRQRPCRLIAAAGASVAMWGLQWSVSWSLLVAMGFPWPPRTVVAGSTAAALANLLPFNAVGNLGTLEAGWTAAFTALGLPLQDAAATGLAAHLWGLAFAAGFGLIAWVVLSVTTAEAKGN